MVVDVDALGQFRLVEIRPIGIGKQEFGVGDLIEKAIGKPLLAGGPNEKVDVGILRSGEKLSLEILFRQGIGIQLSILDLLGDLLCGKKDLLSSAVVEEDVEDMALAVLGVFHRLQDRLAGILRDSFVLKKAQNADADVLLPEVVDFLFEECPQKAEEGRYLILGPIPVLRGKAIEGGRMDAIVLETGRDDFLDSLDTGPMSHGAAKEPLLGPPSVAIHDKGDVTKVLAHLDGLDVLDLLGEHLVDLLGVLVGCLLDVIEDVVLLVFGEGLVLLDLVVVVLADVAEGNLAVLGILLALLDEFLSSVFARSRELEDDGATVDDGIATEVRLVDAAEDILGRGRIKGLDDKIGRGGDGDGSDMLQGHVGIVDMNHDLVEQGWGNASGTKGAKGIPEGSKRLFHLFNAFIQNSHIGDLQFVNTILFY